jgi:hypothetical protein
LKVAKIRSHVAVKACKDLPAHPVNLRYDWIFPPRWIALARHQAAFGLRLCGRRGGDTTCFPCLICSAS